MAEQVIKLNKKLYKHYIIKKTIKLFGDAGDFSLQKSDDYFLVKIKNINPQVKNIIKDEFCNYLIYLTK